jgi:hypothetical protein
MLKSSAAAETDRADAALVGGREGPAGRVLHGSHDFHWRLARAESRHERSRRPGGQEPHAVPWVVLGGRTMQSSELAVVSTFRTTADAQIAKGILDDAGIESMVRTDDAGGMYPAIGGAELLVRVEDVQKANEELNRRHYLAD